MAITPSELGTDEDLARRVLVGARIIAPCLDSLEADSDARKDALAILRGIVSDVAGRGSRFVRSQGVLGANVTYERAASYFERADRIGLQSLCGIKTTVSAVSRASFPPAGIITRIWPEDRR